MKKLLLVLTILAGFIAAAPRAEAGQYRKIYTPYGVKYVNKYGGNYYGSNHNYRSHRNYRHHRYSRSYRSYPVYRNSYRSYPVYRSGYRSYPRYYNSGYYNSGYYNSGHCNTGYRSSHYYSSRPRVSVSFGF